MQGNNYETNRNEKRVEMVSVFNSKGYTRRTNLVARALARIFVSKRKWIPKTRQIEVARTGQRHNDLRNDG